MSTANQSVEQQQGQDTENQFELDDQLPDLADAGLLPEELAVLEKDSPEQSADTETAGAGADNTAQEAVAAQEAGTDAATASTQPTDEQQVQEQHEQGQPNELDAINEDIVANKTLLDDAQTQKTELHTALTDLGKKFDEGEIAQGEYDAKKAQIQDQLDDIKSDIRQYSEKSKQLESSYAAKHSAMQQSYEKTVTDWLSKPENVDVFKPGTAAFAMLDLQVQTISRAMPNIPVTEALDRARDASFRALRMQDTAPAGTAQNTAKQQEQRKPKRSETQVEIQQTLSDMNSAEQNTLGEFGHIEKLTGMEYEAAIAALPADAMKRFLDGQA